MPVADWANFVLERLGVPPVVHQPAYVDELRVAWRRVLETALVEYLTIPELASVRAILTSGPSGGGWREPLSQQPPEPLLWSVPHLAQVSFTQVLHSLNSPKEPSPLLDPFLICLTAFLNSSVRRLISRI